MKSAKLVPMLLTSLVFLAVWTGCSKEEDAYVIPDTYNFDNVNYTGQLQRISMLNEMKAYMSLASNNGFVLDADRLKAMYSNDMEAAQWSGNYDDSKQLKSKTFEGVRDDFAFCFDRIAEASQSTVPSSNGQAGRVQSTVNPDKTYLLDANGLEQAQIIQKGLMGACFYYQATAVYMGAEKMSADNSYREEGSATLMEHYWDEAFGYLGLPTDYPTNVEGLQFWGSYLEKRNAVLENREDLYNSLIKGRAAISANLLGDRDEAIETARHEWEKLVVACALHYLNDSYEHFEDLALKAHGLSEAIGFIYSLQFNPSKRITNQRVEHYLAAIGGAASFPEMNLYATSKEDLLQVRDELAADYGFEELKSDF